MPSHLNCDDPSIASYCRGCRCPGCQAASTAKSSAWRRSRTPVTPKSNSTMSVAETYDCTLTLGEWKRFNEEAS